MRHSDEAFLQHVAECFRAGFKQVDAIESHLLEEPMPEAPEVKSNSIEGLPKLPTASPANTELCPAATVQRQRGAAPPHGKLPSRLGYFPAFRRTGEPSQLHISLRKRAD